jgi:gamma-glutamyltranspeptidase/glutathione hydrolase
VVQLDGAVRAADGRGGAAATAHPLATAAALDALSDGGTAADAALAAQAVLCVTSPHSCGVGGDVMALVREPAGAVTAVNGTGRSAHAHDGRVHAGGGPSATVPGAVAGWERLHARWGRLPWARVLDPAVRLAADGVAVGPGLAAALRAHRTRLERGGAGEWDLLREPDAWRQPELAALLRRIADEGVAAFYAGGTAAAIARATARHGGGIDTDDLAAHTTVVAAPVTVPWDGGTLHVQPPSSQGVLLALALRTVDGLPMPATGAAAGRDHLLVEVTRAAFAHRDDCADAAAVLARRLDVDPERAARHGGGPRAYLHTAGVATADAEGGVVSSLVSVFDSFGSGVFVPEHGFALNNRGGGFTAGANAPRPSAFPVHTLAPALHETPGGVLALATPGADGQVQTLLQVLVRLRDDRALLADAVAAPRWRSEDGGLLVEDDHPAVDDLRTRGHDVRLLPAGDDRFGAVVAARWHRGHTGAVGDGRRRTAAGALA